MDNPRSGFALILALAASPALAQISFDRDPVAQFRRLAAEGKPAAPAPAEGRPASDPSLELNRKNSERLEALIAGIDLGIPVDPAEVAWAKGYVQRILEVNIERVRKTAALAKRAMLEDDAKKPADKRLGEAEITRQFEDLVAVKLGELAVDVQAAFETLGRAKLKQAPDAGSQKSR